MVVKADEPKRSWLERLWDRFWAIDRIPLFHDVVVRLQISPLPIVMDRILLANGTTWLVMSIEDSQNIVARATTSLTSESVQQMQDYQGDAVFYALVCPDDQEERLFNRNHYV